MPATLTTRMMSAKAAKPPEQKPKPAKDKRTPTSPKQPVFVAASPATVNQGGGGSPMPQPVRSTIEKSLQVDLGAVRVHTDTSAHTANKNLSARAFAYGNHIFLGQGETPANVGLMAHEAAHVVQQRGAPKVQRWSSRNSSDSCEHEAHRASAAVLSGQTFSVNERTTGAKVQRFGISDLINYFADKANNIPGYRMFTLIIGVNPINMEKVERTPANIFRAAIELIPGGKLITDVLEKHGLLEKGAEWVATQFKKLAMVGEAFIKAIEDFVDDLGWRSLLHPFRLWERAKRIVLDPVEKIIEFVGGLVAGIIELIKKAILIPLAMLAKDTPAWDLLCAVLGKNPITGEPVPRTPDTLIGGFMKLIGQEEIWENIKKANAISRAFEWFTSALKGLLGFVMEIPSVFIQALKDLELVDILILPKAFIKIGKVFLGFFGRFFAWAWEQIWTLLQIIFEVVAPSVMPYLKKAMAAFRSILRNPGGFVGNLVKAAKQGFQLFSSHFLQYLKKALIGWLTGTLEGANIYIPQGFSFMEIIKFVLSVLGLTWQNIRQKLVKAIGETAVKALETGFDLVKTLVTQGPAAAWEQIQQGISNLKEMVIDGIMSFVKDRIVTAAVTKLLSLLNPASAFIQAIIAIYNTIKFFIERLRQIGQVVAAFIDSISAIANGIIGAASQKVADTLGGLLTLVISFLARLVGLGNVGDAVKNIVDKVRSPIDKALDRVVEWLVERARTLASHLLGGRPNAPSEERVTNALAEAVPIVNRFGGQVVGETVLRPLLVPLKLRHRLTRLDVIPGGDFWLVDAAASPGRTAATRAKVGGATGGTTPPSPTHYQPSPLDEFGRSTSVTGEPISRASLVNPERVTGIDTPGKFLVPSEYKYEAGHLLPHTFGGPDRDPQNLAAISATTNGQFSAIETRVRNALRANPDAVIRYVASCHYSAEGPGRLDSWIRENFPTVTSADLFDGIGELIFSAIKKGSWPADAIARKLRISRDDVIDVERNLRLKAAYLYLPHSFTITVTVLAGNISVSGGTFDNHLPNPRFPGRPGVPPLFLQQQQARRTPP